jgi:hypothetical protein
LDSDLFEPRLKAFIAGNRAYGRQIEVTMGVEKPRHEDTLGMLLKESA